MYFKSTLLLLALLRTTSTAPVSDITTAAANNTNTSEIEARGELASRIVWGVCRNDPKSNTPLKFTWDWGTRDSSYNYLSPGSSSTIFTNDCDGFYIDAGCRGTSVDGVKVWPSGRWTKINDLQNYMVKIIC